MVAVADLRYSLDDRVGIDPDLAARAAAVIARQPDAALLADMLGVEL